MRTCSIEEFIAKLQAGERFVLVDTREEASGRRPPPERAPPEQGRHRARHRDGDPGQEHADRDVLRRRVPGSVLASDNLQKMGYTDVISLDGGWRGWNETRTARRDPGGEVIPEAAWL